MENFTPIPSLIGGILIGLSAAAMMYFNGRIAGISGIFGGLVAPVKGEVGWRASFFAGLILGGVALLLFYPAAFDFTGAPGSMAALTVAGILVGFGTRLGAGCTSGHGVCGLSRFSLRSFVATLTFMAVAGGTVYVTQHVLGGAP
jgi:uncharacterized protein